MTRRMRGRINQFLAGESTALATWLTFIVVDEQVLIGRCEREI